MMTVPLQLHGMVPKTIGHSVAFRGPRPWIDVTAYGARGDGVKLTNASISSGTASLSDSAASFTASDVGKMVNVVGAGTGGITLATTILSVQSATAVTLAANAVTTVSGGIATYGTNDTSAFQSALNAATLVAGSVRVPGGRYLIAAGSGAASLEIKASTDFCAQANDGAILDLNAVGATIECYSDDVTVRGLTFEKLDADANMLSFKPEYAASSLSTAPDRCTVEQCRFLTNGSATDANTATIGVYGAGSGTGKPYYFTCRDNYIEYSHIALIYKYGAYYPVMEGNTCVNKGSDATAEGTKQEWVIGARCVDNTFISNAPCYSAISIVNLTEQLIVSGNYIEINHASAAYGIKIESDGGSSPTNTLISGNHIRGNGSNTGIYSGSGTDPNFVVQGNKLRGCAIRLTVNDQHVIGNYVEGATGTNQAGISVEGNSHVVKGNTIIGCPRGISAVAGSTATGLIDVSGNTVLDCTEYGILETKTTNVYIRDNLVRTTSAITTGIWSYSAGSNKIVKGNIVEAGSATNGIKVESVTAAQVLENTVLASTNGIALDTVTTCKLFGNHSVATTPYSIATTTTTRQMRTAACSGALTLTNSAQNITGCSLSLEPGDWLVTGVFHFITTGAADIGNGLYGGIATSGGTVTVANSATVAVMLAQADAQQGTHSQTWAVSVSATTTVNLTGQKAASTAGTSTVAAGSTTMTAIPVGSR